MDVYGAVWDIQKQCSDPVMQQVAWAQAAEGPSVLVAHPMMRGLPCGGKNTCPEMSVCGRGVNEVL